MRCSIWGLLALVCVAVAGPKTAVATPDLPPPSAGESLLHSDAARWRYQLITAPRIAPQIGALAVSGLDVVAGRAPAPIDVLGGGPVLPAAWPYDVDNAATATGALAPKPPADMRVAALLAVTTFPIAIDQ